MQAVILAAGKGTRMRPWTDRIPKPLIRVNGICLIDRVINTLPSSITNILVITGYKGEQIRNHLGTTTERGIPITYVEQTELNGTAGALHQASQHLEEQMLVMNADDIYTKQDLESMTHYPWAILIKETRATIPNPATIDNNNRFIGLGHINTSSVWQVCGAYTLQKSFLNTQSISINETEQGIPQTLASIASTVQITAIKATAWMPVGTPEEHNAAETALKTTEK